MANARRSRRSEELICFRASHFSKFPMAGAQVFICLLLVGLPFHAAEQTPKRHTLRERAPEDRSPPSHWSSFLSKFKKSLATVDSAIHLIRGSKNSDRGASEVISAAGHRPDASPMPMKLQDATTRASSPTTASTAPLVTESLNASMQNLKRLSEEPCGNSLGNLTVDETLASPGQFPWMALLRYRAKDSTMEWFCGGSLINDRYVLTAASCLDIPEYTLVSVRLGEYNLDFDEPDCSDLEDDVNDVVAVESCYTKPPVDYGISSVQAHPKFILETGENNVGLIRLNEKVKYTELIGPVCLPLGDFEIKWNRGKVATDLILAGWGNNVVPKQGTITRVQAGECEDALAATVYPGQMCGDGFCHGEIGDALVTFSKPLTPGSEGEQRFVQLALLSLRMEECVPSIFNSLQRYIHWILATIKP